MLVIPWDLEDSKIAYAGGLANIIIEMIYTLEFMDTPALKYL